MVQPSEHCPHLGLKQNRAIRFASPTAEHRCYVNGAPQDIPVEQANYCLCANYVNCPLYMGLSVPSTIAGNPPAPVGSPARPLNGGAGPVGIIAWLQALPQNEKLIYGMLMAITALMLGIYAITGLRLILPESQAAAPTPTLITTSLAGAGVATPAPSTPGPTDTPMPTRSPSPSPTRRALTAPATVPPPTATPTPRRVVGGGLAPISTLDPANPVAGPSPTRANELVAPIGTVEPVEPIVLYFLGADNTLVPFTLNVATTDRPTAAAFALAAGPPADSGLLPVFPPTIQIVRVELDQTGLATVTLRGGILREDGLGFQALISTLLGLPEVERVQLRYE